MQSFPSNAQAGPLPPISEVYANALNNAITDTTPQNTIGKPVKFKSGFFKNRTIRAQLIELQQADLGRKYARKDRRPIEPPPVVQLKLYDVQGAGTFSQKEIEFDDYDDVAGLGLLCHLDLFPVPDQPSTREDRVSGKKRRQPRHKALLSTDPRPPIFSIILSGPGIPEEDSSFSSPSIALPPMGPADTVFHSSAGSSQFFPNGPVTLPTLHPIPMPVAMFGNYPITEESKCTNELVGVSVAPSMTYSYQGCNALMFIFSDIAVKIEGTFVLRYRVFNIFAEAEGDTEIPVLAECYGGPFKIYATKEFPGLPASTDLTKSLQESGVKVATRAKERKRPREE